MRQVGFWSLGTDTGKRVFTGTSATVLDPANVFNLVTIEGRYFTGQIQNLSNDTDVILIISGFGAVSQVRYTLHARECLICQNVPIGSIGVILNGTVVMQGIGQYMQLDRLEMENIAVVGTAGFSLLQSSFIKIEKISDNSVGTAAFWQDPAVVNNPAALADLVTYTVVTKGYIYGIYIDSPEANRFLLTWTSAAGVETKRYTISAAGGGTIIFTDPIPINAGSSADAATVIKVENINAGVGDYQADLLIGDETV